MAVYKYRSFDLTIFGKNNAIIGTRTYLAMTRDYAKYQAKVDFPEWVYLRVREQIVTPPKKYNNVG